MDGRLAYEDGDGVLNLEFLVHREIDYSQILRIGSRGLEGGREFEKQILDGLCQFVVVLRRLSSFIFGCKILL